MHFQNLLDDIKTCQAMLDNVRQESLIDHVCWCSCCQVDLYLYQAMNQRWIQMSHKQVQTLFHEMVDQLCDGKDHTRTRKHQGFYSHLFWELQKRKKPDEVDCLEEFTEYVVTFAAPSSVSPELRETLGKLLASLVK